MNAFHTTDAVVAVGPMTGSPLRRAKTARGLMSPRNSCVQNATGGMSFSAATAPETSRSAPAARTRLAYSFGWEGGDEVPPGSSLIEIDLIDNDAGAGTLRRMTHSGLPNAVDCTSLDKGWAYYLDRLAHAAANHDPGPDRGPPH
jgi:Activator of Hsp90 ATPase homolog 1-like protein